MTKCLLPSNFRMRVAVGNNEVEVEISGTVRTRGQAEAVIFAIRCLLPLLEPGAAEIYPHGQLVQDMGADPE